MKIAQLAPPWIPIPPKNYGGTESVIYNLIEEQVAQGHDVTLFAPGDAKTSAKHVSFFPESLIESGVPWQAHLKASYHIYRTIEYIKAHTFDIVHTHLSTSTDLYTFPLLASLDIPHVTTMHSNFPFDGQPIPEGWIGDADQYYMYWALSNPIVAISQTAHHLAPEKLNIVGVVHHGIPTNQFLPTAKGEGGFFVWLGRLVPEKGPDIAIEAAKRANVPIVLAGIIPHNSSRSVTFFEEVIKPQIDNRQVKYIGPVNMKQKIDLLSHARGFLNPIKWEEPFGMVMIEAMAVGCPVIAFDYGAAAEIVVHQKTGFLVHNVDEMTQFISHIDEIDREITRGHVERNFSDRVMAEKYIEIYKKVIFMGKEVRNDSFSYLIKDYSPLAIDTEP